MLALQIYENGMHPYKTLIFEGFQAVIEEKSARE